MDNLPKNCIVHQLPELAACGHPPSYEYPLPAQIDPSQEVLIPWLHDVSNLNSAEAHAYLCERWRGLRHVVLRRLRDWLLESGVRSLIVTGNRAWLLCVDDGGGGHLIAPPGDKHFVETQLRRYGMADHLALKEFLEHFGGLREDFAPSGGWFIDEQPWEFIDQPFMDTIPGCSDWRGSLIVFHSRGGDLLLQHPSGRVGWWVADEVRMREAYADLETCLADFMRYRDFAWPFDPYEPRNANCDDSMIIQGPS